MLVCTLGDFLHGSPHPSIPLSQWCSFNCETDKMFVSVAMEKASSTFLCIFYYMNIMAEVILDTVSPKGFSHRRLRDPKIRLTAAGLHLQHPIDVWVHFNLPIHSRNLQDIVIFPLPSIYITI